jgi:hypothetical protein
MLRTAIKQDSFLPTKQTTLQEKIEGRTRNETVSASIDGAIFEEKMIIEQSDKPKKMSNKKPTMTLSENSKGKSF